jgi:hypothetical protein
MTTTAPATTRKGKGGPKTEAGKMAVALNAAKHGVMSLAPVIPGLEAEEEMGSSPHRRRGRPVSGRATRGSSGGTGGVATVAPGARGSLRD